MPNKFQSSGKGFAEGPFLRRLPARIGAGVTALGALVIIAWFAHWPALIQILPHLAPMKFNTALCFIFCGTALMLFDTKFAKFVPGLGGLASLTGALTLLEYFTNRSFGIDQLFVADFVLQATTFAGRMSPLTASCFLLMGVSISLAVTTHARNKTLTAAALLACIVAVVASVALFGYFMGIEVVYGWGAYTRMAVHTATAFLALGGGLLVWTWQAARRSNLSFLRWLPVTGSLTLLVMIGSISAAGLAQLKRDSDWRRHSYQVLTTAQTFLGDVFSMQRGMRNFVLTSQAEALQVFDNGATNAPRRLAELAVLTRDNPSQQQRLKTLVTDLGSLLTYSHGLIETRKTRGLEAAIQMESTGRGFEIAKHTVDHLNAFTDAESTLLNNRSTATEADFHNTAGLLIFGSALAGGLLIFANWLASREMARRRRAEERQARLAAEIKGLLESTGEGIYGIDLQGACTFINPVGARMIGYEPEEVIGRNMHELIHHSRNDGSPYPVQECPIFLAFHSDLSCRVDSEVFWRKDRSAFLVEYTSFPVIEANVIKGAVISFTDISERRHREAEREKLIADLQNALAEVKTLSGLIPICGWCKNVRSDTGYWQSVEQYFRSRTDATFSHGMCPTCAQKFEADVARLNSPGAANAPKTSK